VLELLLELLPPASILVIAPPDESKAGWQESLLEAARARGVESLAPVDVNERSVVDAVVAFDPGLLLSVYYTQIFRPELLSAVRGPCLNFHPSLLPRHRGHAPVIWAIVEGDAVTGLSVHHVDRGVDTGPLVYRRPLPIHPLDTGFDVHQKMNWLVRSTAAVLLRRLAAGAAVPVGEEQVGTASLHSRADPQVNHLDWSLPAARIRNIVRALAPPLPGAFVRFAELTIPLSSVEPAASPSGEIRPAGLVELEDDGTPVVWAADAPLRIRSFVDVEGRVRPGRELAQVGVGMGSLLT